MDLREATAELHSKAEKMEFNQRMFRGELSTEEYVKYLYQQLSIFDGIESNELPHSSLARVDKVKEDILELTSQLDIMNILPITLAYSHYISTLTQEERLPHVYLNYLALAYGGQIMKSKVPGSGKMYEFEGEMMELIGSVRAIQKDEWADEVNKGFQYIINILDEL